MSGVMDNRCEIKIVLNSQERYIQIVDGYIQVFCVDHATIESQEENHLHCIHMLYEGMYRVYSYDYHCFLFVITPTCIYIEL